MIIRTRSKHVCRAAEQLFLKLKRYEVQQKVGIGKDTYSGISHSIGISTRKEKDEKEN